MMKKRLFSIFCALAVCLALLPGMTLSASAANGPCDGTHGDGWTELTAAGGTLSTGKYYLSGDVTATDRINITADVTLCLNGHVLDLNGNYIYVSSGNSLTLCDCGSKTHKFTVGDDGLWTWDEEHGDEEVTGGVITGGKGYLSNNYYTYGGGVCVNGGTLTMESGNIVGNTATNGGGVYVQRDGSFTMSGGSIEGNNATWGGGVCVLGNYKFTMSDGSISGNTAAHSGGVYVQSGTFTMSDGSISGNTAAHGGGVLVYDSTFDMSGGSISDNTATKYGGGVYVQRDGSFTMSGGSITGNNATNRSGGVYVYSSTGQLQLRSAPEIDGEIWLGNKPIEITGELSNTEPFQLTNVSGTFTSGWGTYMADADPASYFTINRTGYHVGLSSGEVAVLANTYTVTFNSNGGTGTMGNMTFTYDTAQALAPNAFTKTGYTFTGWSDGDNTYTDEQEVKNLTSINSATVTLTAQWTPNTYTVTFDPGDGEGSSYTQTFTYDTEQALKPNAFTKTGYSFTKWSGSDGHDYTDGQEVSNLTTENDITITLTAQWTPNTYTVTLHPNEGEIDGSTPDSDGNYVIHYTYGIGAALPTEKEIARSGYRFGGWYDNEKLEGEPVTEITATDIGNKTYWARWDYISGTPTYSVILPDNVTGGEVTANKRYAEKGETFRFTVKPDEGYALSALTVTDSKGSELALTNEGSGVWSFKMPASKVTVEAVFVPVTLPFTDVPENAWYYDAVWYTYTHGLMNGTSATTFAPGGTTSRAMIVTILWRQAGSPVVNYAMHFDDVSQGQWYSEAIR